MPYLGERKRLLLIMNPRAGTRKANRVLTDILGLFMAHGYESLVCVTEQQGDAARFVKERGEEVELIVAIGGDGTLNEVITGMMTAGMNKPLGYIPAGSTNDFAASLKLEKNILKAAETVVTGETSPLDIGRFGERYFSYVASFGAFTRTSYATSQNIKNTMGHMAYLLQGLRDLGSMRPYHVKIETDEETFEGEYLFGAISNTTSVGGVLTLDPKRVDMNDGLFELLLIKYPKGPLEWNECIRALTTQDYTSHMITFRNTPRLTVTASAEMNWTLDGEFEAGHEVVEIENLYSAIGLQMKKKS